MGYKLFNDRKCKICHKHAEYMCEKCGKYFCNEHSVEIEIEPGMIKRRFCLKCAKNPKIKQPPTFGLDKYGYE